MPSIKKWSRSSTIWTIFLQTSNPRNQAQHYPWRVGDNDWPILFRSGPAIGDPEAGVDRGHEGLDWIALLSGQVAGDLSEVGNVHQDGNHGRDPANILVKLVMCHGLLLFLAALLDLISTLILFKGETARNQQIHG